MTGEGEGESWGVLTEHRLGREGLAVKLERGFEVGTYCVYVEFHDLASRVGFAAAHRRAADFCKLLKAQLGRFAGHSLAETEDASRSAGPGRKRDLELTYLTFAVLTNNGRFHDEAMTEEFRLALLRASQQWDQVQARAGTQRHDGRREAFRVRLAALLAGDAFQHLDQATRERLLKEVPPRAFPPRGAEL